MPIRFKCANCGNPIKAPDHAAGRSSACPVCGILVFIPRPKTADDDLGLAPLDEAESQKMQKQMDDENRELDRALGSDVERALSDGKEKKDSQELDEVAIESLAIDWLLASVESRDEEAANLVRKLAGKRREVAMLLDGLNPALLENPALSDMPPPLFRKLKEKLVAKLA